MSNELPAVGVSMKSIAGSGKDGTEIVLQTHFPAELSSDAMDLLLDKYTGLLARQRQVGEIPAILENIQKHTKSIAEQEADLDRIDRDKQGKWDGSGRQGPVKLTDSDKAQRENAATNLKRWKDMLAIEEQKLKDAYTALEAPSKKVKAAKAA